MSGALIFGFELCCSAFVLRPLEIRTSPHFLSGHSVDTIMFNVVLALLPTSLWAIYAFGLAAVLVLGTTVALFLPVFTACLVLLPV